MAESGFKCVFFWGFPKMVPQLSSKSTKTIFWKTHDDLETHFRKPPDISWDISWDAEKRSYK